MINIKTLTLSAPQVDKREILRYAGVRGEGESIMPLLDECLAEADKILVYKVCYAEIERESEYGKKLFAQDGLKDYLSECFTAVILGATVGIELDRLISKYGRLSPTKALLFQAIGAERIEALCDRFWCDFQKTVMSKGAKALPRISPGYGNFPLESQRELFAVLDLNRKIGLSLNDSLLMSPSKSVTAVFGI